MRGGGEYGREWHKAGQLMNKPNTWRDLIDVCEELCREKYTAPGRLAIHELGNGSRAKQPSANLTFRTLQRAPKALCSPSS